MALVRCSLVVQLGLLVVCGVAVRGGAPGAASLKTQDTYRTSTALPDYRTGQIPGLDKYTRTRYFIIKAVIITGLGAFFRKGMRRGFN